MDENKLIKMAEDISAIKKGQEYIIKQFEELPCKEHSRKIYFFSGISAAISFYLAKFFS